MKKENLQHPHQGGGGLVLFLCFCHFRYIDEYEDKFQIHCQVGRQYRVSGVSGGKTPGKDSNTGYLKKENIAFSLYFLPHKSTKAKAVRMVEEVGERHGWAVISPGS